MQKILVALARRSCYSFAVTLFSVAGGQAAAMVGFLFIAVTVDLSRTGTFGYLLILLLTLTAAATTIHYLFYGLGEAVGRSWGLAWLRPLNQHMDGIRFREGVPADTWPAINRALERLPFSSTKLAGLLSISVVGVCVIAEYIMTGSAMDSLGILRGGLIATVLYGCFSFSIIELLTSPARREARRNLIQLHQGSVPAGYSRLSVKLGLFLALILISVVISHGLFTADRTASSTLIMVSFGTVVLLLGFGAAVLVFWSITKPLSEIKEAAALLSSANRAEFSTGSLDREFISAASGFYEYAQRIVDYRRELQDFNRSLEKLVAERTSELKQANEALERKIEEVRRAGLALRDSEEKYRTLIEKMQDGVFLLLEGSVVFANHALGQMLGFKPEKLVGKTFRDVVAPEDLELVGDYYHRRLRGEPVPDLYEIHLLHRDGKKRLPVMMSVGLIRSAEGRVYSMGTLKDITVLKAAELERERRARLEGIMAMAGAASHELSQPLQAAYGRCEIAMNQLGQDHDLYGRFASILEELERLGDLTNKIQHITRDESTWYAGGDPIVDIDMASQPKN